MLKEPAELKMEESLKANPKQPGVWCSLGEMRLRGHRLPEARAAFENALHMEPGLAQAHFGLAGAWKEQGKPVEAIASYRSGLASFPDNGQALLDLGVLLAEHSQADEAIVCWQKLLVLQPGHAQAYHNLGVAMAQKGENSEAVRYLEKALALKPDYAEANFNLGNVLCNLKTREDDRRTAGVERYREAIRLRPGYIEPLYNLGTVLTELNRPAEGAIWLRQAARIGEGRGTRGAGRENRGNIGEGRGPTAPSPLAGEGWGEGCQEPHPLTASAYNQLGLALCMQAKYADAEVEYRRALALGPDLADVHSNMGNMYQEQGRLPEALACYELGIMHEPGSAVTKWNRALSILQSGDFELGWREYEWRWQRKQTPPRPFKEPRWDGSPFPDKTLLIHMEQGLGDMIQFIRFAAGAKERGGRILVECPGFLVPLLNRCPGIDEIAPEGILGTGNGSSPKFDLQIPVMSLPGVLGTTLATVPARVPYVFVDNELVARRREKLREALLVQMETIPQHGDKEKGRQGDKEARNRPMDTIQQTPPTPPYQEGEKFDSRSTIPDPRLRIGIVWQGNPNHRLDRYRSIPLREFALLARIPGVRLVSLQKGPGALQIQQMPATFSIWEPGQSDQMTAQALLDTAALIKNLDLVISVDTGTCHLAGALGVPVWVPMNAIGEWRWLLHREDSPWYPTMRLFRQKVLGQWRPVFRRMVRELKIQMPMAKKCRAKR